MAKHKAFLLAWTLACFVVNNSNSLCAQWLFTFKQIVCAESSQIKNPTMRISLGGICAAFYHLAARNIILSVSSRNSQRNQLDVNNYTFAGKAAAVVVFHSASLGL